MSFGAIGGAVATSVIGGMLSGSGDSPGQPSQSQTSTGPFNLEGGLFGGSSFDPKTGQVNQVLDPRLASIQGQGFDLGAGFNQQAMTNPNIGFANQAGGNFLQGLGQQNPLDLQSQLFQQQSTLLQPGFDQQNLDLEGRLFAQGRLGSTSGSNQQNAQLDSQNTAFGQLLAQSFQQSQQQQAQQANLGQSLAGFSPQLAGMFQNVGAAGLQQSLGIEGAGQNALANAGNLTTSSTTTGATPGHQSGVSVAGDALLASGMGGFGTAVGGLFQGAPVDFFGTPESQQGTQTRTRLF